MTERIERSQQCVPRLHSASRVNGTKQSRRWLTARVWSVLWFFFHCLDGKNFCVTGKSETQSLFWFVFGFLALTFATGRILVPQSFVLVFLVRVKCHFVISLVRQRFLVDFWKEMFCTVLAYFQTNCRTRDSEQKRKNVNVRQKDKHFLIVMVLPAKMVWNVLSTFVESNADVSMNIRLCFLAKIRASSVLTVRKCLKSDLFPTRMMQISSFVKFLISLSHSSACSKLLQFDMS